MNCGNVNEIGPLTGTAQPDIRRPPRYADEPGPYVLCRTNPARCCSDRGRQVLNDRGIGEPPQVNLGHLTPYFPRNFVETSRRIRSNRNPMIPSVMIPTKVQSMRP